MRQKTISRTVSHSPTRQRRQHRAVTAVATTRVNARQFRRLQDMVLWIQERRGYRWLARFTNRGHGWWQQVGAGHRLRVAPTLADYSNVKRIYDVMQDGKQIDDRAFGLLLEVITARSQMDAALSKLINLVRRDGAKTLQTTPSEFQPAAADGQRING